MYYCLPFYIHQCFFKTCLFRNMLYIVLIIVLCLVKGHSAASKFILGPPSAFLNCIEITSRSIIECALRASVMDHYENRLAYRNGKCHVCRADNENCVVSEDEYQLAGPHFIKGECCARCIVGQCIPIIMRTLRVLLRFVVIRCWPISHIASGLLHRHRDNHTIVSAPIE